MVRNKSNKASAALALAPGLFLFAAGLAVCGCRKAPEVELLQQAEALVLNAEWEAAIPVLKRHLLTHPNDCGAHFYLGRCYLNAESETPLVMFALGELETALDLFKQRGHPNTIERFSDTYFELICHLERTKVYLKQSEFVMDAPNIGPATRREILAGILERCDEELLAARGIEPESSDVKHLDLIIRRLRQSLGIARGSDNGPALIG